MPHERPRDLQLYLHGFSLTSLTSELQNVQVIPVKIQNPVRAYTVRLLNTCVSPDTDLGADNINRRETVTPMERRPPLYL